MADNNGRNRRSIRLKGYDYTQAGAYFVTLCTQERAYLFGEVVDGEMRLNDAGKMIERWWNELNNKFPQSKTDAHRVMPNHFHGVIAIVVGADLRVCPNQTNAFDETGTIHETGLPCETGAHAGAPLPKMLQWFKTMTTNEYIRCVKQQEWPPFHARLWQRNYYEHIIRNEESLNRIRQYIFDNPARWPFDRENPMATTLEPENAWSA
jgi:REP element-mobilizing transposase RayT